MANEAVDTTRNYFGTRMTRVSAPKAVAPPEEPPLDPHHDVLVLHGADLYRFAHAPKSSELAGVDPQLVAPRDPGYRKVKNVARSDAHEMAFAAFPIKPEPASEFFSCYFTNTAALNFFDPRDAVNPMPNPSRDVWLIQEQDEQKSAQNLLYELPWEQNGPTKKPPQNRSAEAELYAEIKAFTGTQGDPSRVALALLPRELSATAPVKGRLLNLDLIHSNNPWTTTDWNDHPESLKAAVDIEPGAASTPKLALAFGPNALFKVDVAGTSLRWSEINLAQNATIADFLAKGVALGSITLDGERRDLINVRSFASDQDGVPPERLLLALASGTILDVPLDPKESAARVLEGKDLRGVNLPIWQMLRNGCIAGKVQLEGARSRALLVNLTAFSCGTTARKQDPELSGTLDFKWPQKKQLRVRFEKPEWLQTEKDEEIFQVAYRKLVEIANDWTAGTNLTWDFKPVAPDDPEYDILINLDALPTPQRRDNASRHTTVDMPSSDLGSYALRRSFGTPSMYLGRTKGLKEDDGTTIADEAAYFVSRMFRRMALHEFGHALGLPHLHQHPDLGNPFKAVATVQSIMRSKLGIELTAEFIQEHLLLRWPGNFKFSEWPTRERLEIAARAHATQEGSSATTPEQAAERPPIRPEELAKESVMMGLLVRDIIVGARPRSVGEPNMDGLMLGDFDREWIQRMYPR